jgi:chloride channel protein, CIC family
MSKNSNPLKRLWLRFRQTARAANIDLLGAFLRLVPSESHRVFALTLVVGALCGAAAVLFHLGIIAVEARVIDRAMAAPSPHWIWLTLLTPAAGGLLSGALLYFVVPGARGSGIPQVKVAYAVKGGRVPFIDAVGKFLIGILQIGTGSSLGREGPTVQICAGVASSIGRAAALSRENLRRLLPVGAAAGIAAAFNAPIAAVTFTLEEVVGDLDQAVLSWIVVASAIAAGIERSVLGEHPVFTITTHAGLSHASSLLVYAALGVAAAVVSLAFTESLLRLRGDFQRLRLIPAWARPAIGGLITGLLAAAALFWLQLDGVTGGGYATLSLALSGSIAIRALVVLCVFKLIATVFSYASGGAGGIFAPSLFIGGMLGGLFGHLDMAVLHHADNQVGAFALVGMGAVFAGIVRAPITSVLIIFEMTGSYELILPLMISNMTAYALARRLRPTPIYEALLVQDKIHLPHRRGPVSHALEQLTVRDAMTSSLVIVPAEETPAMALERISAHSFSTYPVVNAAQEFLGLITEARIRRSLAENAKQSIGQLVDQIPCLSPDSPLIGAAMRMHETKTRQMPVVHGSELVGLLTMTDIVAAQALAAKDASGMDRTATPAFAEERTTLEE